MLIESLKSFFDTGAVILLFLTFLFGVGVLITGNIINQRQAIQIRQFEKDLREKELKIAEANDRAGAAIERASNADERASRNEKDAARLTKEAEDERMARVKIEARVAWRRLTLQQKAHLAAAVGRFSNQAAANFWFSAGDTEASWFAADIADALHTAKLHVYPPASLMQWYSGKLDEPVRRVETGVKIFSSPKFPQTQLLADSLSRELNDCGFDATSQIDPSLVRQSEIQVYVNARPDGPQGEAKLQAQKGTKKP